MQKLIQKSKFVPIEKICPEWVMHIAKLRSLRNFFMSESKHQFTGKDQKYYNIYKRPCCIVGEAWKGDENYGKCFDCEIFATTKFMFISSFGKLNENLNEFAEHWNKEHL